MTKVSKQYPLKHYQWGQSADGWNFVEEESFSVKQERMPVGASEQWHYHQKAQQFFFILKGVASLEIDDEVYELHAQEGLHVLPGKKHRISNNHSEDLEFILCSQPSAANDRINL